MILPNPPVAREKKTKRSLWFSIAAAILALFIIISLWFLLLSADKAYWRAKVRLGPKPLARVGHHAIFQSDLDPLIKSAPFNTDKKQILAVLMDNWLYKEMAKANGITVSDQQITSEVLKRSGIANNKYQNIQLPVNASDQQKTALQQILATENPASIVLKNNYLKLQVANALYKNKLTEKIKGGYQGQFIIAHFDQNILFSDSSKTSEQAKMSAADLATKVADDRKYATDFINSIYQQLTTNHLSFSNAIALEKKDPRLGSDVLPTVVHSGDFNAVDKTNINNLLATNTQVTAQLDSLKPGQVSKPFIYKVNSSTNNPQQLADGYWIIVRLDTKTTKLAGYDSFDALITAYKKKLNYKTYHI